MSATSQTRWLIALLALVLTVGACGGGDDSGSDGASPDVEEDDGGDDNGDGGDAFSGSPCDLLTEDDVTGVIGFEVTEEEESAASCIWRVVGGNELTLVSVQLFDDPSWEAGVSRGAEPLSGVGDEAFVATDPSYVHLYVRDGGTNLLVIVSVGVDPDTGSQIGVDLAGLALATT